jgi:hypothetical protein
MPTPVGPVPPDPHDPDLWDWDADDDVGGHRRPVRIILVGTVVLLMVLLLLVNLL